MTAHESPFDPPRGVPMNDWLDLIASLDHWLALHGMTLSPGLHDVARDHRSGWTDTRDTDPVGGGDR